MGWGQIQKMRIYKTSPEKRLAAKAFRESERGRTYIAAYEKSPERAASLERYRASPEYKEYRKRYNASPRGRAADRLRKKKYRATAHGKEMTRKYNQSAPRLKFLEGYYSSPAGKASRHRRHIKATFGLTVQQYEAMIEKQRGMCAICGAANANGKRLSVDHRHRDGKIRSLLCHSCNVMVGFSREKPENLRRAAEYLELHNV